MMSRMWHLGRFILTGRVSMKCDAVVVSMEAFYSGLGCLL